MTEEERVFQSTRSTMVLCKLENEHFVPQRHSRSNGKNSTKLQKLV